MRKTKNKSPPPKPSPPPPRPSPPPTPGPEIPEMASILSTSTSSALLTSTSVTAPSSNTPPPVLTPEQSCPATMTEPKVDGRLDTASINALATLLRESVNTRWRPTQKPPTYAGEIQEDPRAFLDTMEKMLRAVNEPEEEYVAAVKQQLRGKASRWFAPLENIPMAWSTFRQRLLAYFDGPARQVELQSILFGERQNATEIGKEFVARKYRLWQRSTTKDTTLQLQATIQLLSPDYRLILRGRNVASFDDLLDTVEGIDADLLEKDAETKSSRQNPRPQQQPPQCPYCNDHHYRGQCRARDKRANQGNEQ